MVKTAWENYHGDKYLPMLKEFPWGKVYGENCMHGENDLGGNCYALVNTTIQNTKYEY